MAGTAPVHPERGTVTNATTLSWMLVETPAIDLAEYHRRAVDLVSLASAVEIATAGTNELERA